MKRPVISVRTQRAVAYVLARFLLVDSMDEFPKVWNDVYAKFHLYSDPLTGLPCCIKDYQKFKVYYDNYKKEKKYGHCDGID